LPQKGAKFARSNPSTSAPFCPQITRITQIYYCGLFVRRSKLSAVPAVALAKAGSTFDVQSLRLPLPRPIFLPQKGAKFARSNPSTSAPFCPQITRITQIYYCGLFVRRSKLSSLPAVALAKAGSTFDVQSLRLPLPRPIFLPQKGAKFARFHYTSNPFFFRRKCKIYIFDNAYFFISSFGAPKFINNPCSIRHALRYPSSCAVCSGTNEWHAFNSTIIEFFTNKSAM